jgi:pimeloyl-ACP methyl ester carboxylesterase
MAAVSRRSLAKCVLVGLAGVIIALLLGTTFYQWFATRRDLAAHPPPGRLVDVGGHRLHIWCSGSGTPAVLLDSGLGGSFSDWGYVQPRVAEFTRVCSYDRGGMGYSDPGPTPRTARHIANELAVLIKRAGIAGPVVLAGASLGGLNVRVFAADHAELTSGLVLVDASHEDQTLDMPPEAPYVPLLATTGAFRLLGISFGQPVYSLAPFVREWASATGFRTATYKTALSELRALPETQQEVKSTRHTLNIPVVVVTGGRNEEPTWRNFQRDQVRLSERGCQMIAEGAGHVIAVSQPLTVVKAIRSVVDATRDGTDRPLCG